MRDIVMRDMRSKLLVRLNAYERRIADLEAELQDEADRADLMVTKAEEHLARAVVLAGQLEAQRHVTDAILGRVLRTSEVEHREEDTAESHYAASNVALGLTAYGPTEQAAIERLREMAQVMSDAFAARAEADTSGGGAGVRGDQQ